MAILHTTFLNRIAMHTLTATLALGGALLASPSHSEDPGRTAALEADPVANADSVASPEASPDVFEWRGPDGQPLPFTTHEEILDFLKRAKMVEREELSSGSTRPWKVLLRLDSVEAHGIFRTVVKRRGATGRRQIRDHYLYEVAAYRVSRELGLQRVPPAVKRVLGRHEGSLQLWIENARSESDRIESGDPPENVSTWVYQKSDMRLFDALIHNFDRNTGNVLVDDSGYMWWVDHTRSFKPSMTFPMALEPLICSKTMWRRLQGLDSDRLRSVLRPLLSGLEVTFVVERHKALVELIAAAIASGGEEAVLFEH